MLSHFVVFLQQQVLSRQQEISAYGEGDGKGDAGDNWRLECVGTHSDQVWQATQPVRLQHVDTGKYLSTAKMTEFNVETCGANCPIMNHLEAFGRAAADQHSLLTVQQGIRIQQ
jgi:hypothetical protein